MNRGDYIRELNLVGTEDAVNEVDGFFDEYEIGSTKELDVAMIEAAAPTGMTTRVVHRFLKKQEYLGVYVETQYGERYARIILYKKMGHETNKTCSRLYDIYALNRVDGSAIYGMQPDRLLHKLNLDTFGEKAYKKVISKRK